ncbi:hypothetical protein ACFL08_00005, partial [Patescibacteria group bacterium]
MNSELKEFIATIKERTKKWAEDEYNNVPDSVDAIDECSEKLVKFLQERSSARTVGESGVRALASISEVVLGKSKDLLINAVDRAGVSSVKLSIITMVVVKRYENFNRDIHNESLCLIYDVEDSLIIVPVGNGYSDRRFYSSEREDFRPANEDEIDEFFRHNNSRLDDVLSFIKSYTDYP